MTLKNTIAGIKLAVQTMSDKYDDVLQSLGRHEKETGDLKKKQEAKEKKYEKMQLSELS